VPFWLPLRVILKMHDAGFHTSELPFFYLVELTILLSFRQ